MKNFPFITQQAAINLLRISTSLFLAAHGAIRWYAGTVSGFGDNGFVCCAEDSAIVFRVHGINYKRFTTFIRRTRKLACSSGKSL